MKLYPVDVEYSINCPQSKNEWFLTSIHYHMKVVSSEKLHNSEYWGYSDFESFCNFLDEISIPNVIKYVSWRNRIAIRITDIRGMRNIYLTEKNFKSISIKKEYRYNSEWSLERLRRELPYDDFIKLCLNRGIGEIFQK